MYNEVFEHKKTESPRRIITKESVEENIVDAFEEAKRGNNEHANIRIGIAQIHAIMLLVGQLERLNQQLRRWDCDDRLSITSTSDRFMDDKKSQVRCKCGKSEFMSEIQDKKLGESYKRTKDAHFYGKSEAKP